MADAKLTEQQVFDLATVLGSNSSLDSKINYVTTIKSGIKQYNVPETCIPQLFEGLRAASASQHSSLVNVGFTSLNHLLTRLTRQDPKALTKEAPRTLPTIIDKLGDQKEKFRATAAQSLNTLYQVAPQDVERIVRNSAMAGKNSRAKEAAMSWLLQAHQELGLPFRGYVPSLMDLLEDADGMVRDVAKHTVIELFKNAPGPAKSDLKRQLKNFKVRPAIEQAIVKALAPPGNRPVTPGVESAAPAPPAMSRPAMSQSVSSLPPAERPITPAPESKSENIEPAYVNSKSELDDIFRDMAPFFEGKESEQNWLKREQSITKLRQLNAGNAISDYHDLFLTGLRSMLDGIIKAINSLRTSLSKEGYGLIQEIARSFGPGIDPLVELLLQALIKLSAGTKKISSQLADATVDCVIARVTYTPRIMQHITGACQDKNVQPRTYATGWLKTLIHKEQGHKNHVEHTGGAEMMEKAIRKSLGDANPGVREKMRSTYWTFQAVWPARADAIMEDLDSTAQKLLNKANPKSPKKDAAPTSRPGMGLSKSTMGPPKPSLRETMMAQKKASLAAAKSMPARPGSAMASLSPVKKTSADTSSHSGNAPKQPGSRTRPDPNTISVHASGMSVAPVRPRRRPEAPKPEMAARPATAGPYSVRDHGSSVDSESPKASRSRPAAGSKATSGSPRRTPATRPKPGHASHTSESSITSPVRNGARSAASTRTSPAKPKASRTAEPVFNSPTGAPNEDLALPLRPAPTMSQPIPQLELQPPPQLEQEPKAEQEEQSEPVVEQQPEYSQEPEPEPPVPAAVPEPAEPEPQTSPKPRIPEIIFDPEHTKPAEQLQVYEDPFTEEQQAKPTYTAPVLEDKPVNEDAATLSNGNHGQPPTTDDAESPEKARQNFRLLDSGIAKIKTKSLEVHGFRKLQSLLRDPKTPLPDDKLEALVTGLFQFLEDPLPSLQADRAQDVKAQILATIKLLLKRERNSFQPYVTKCLESLLQTRSVYDGRAHIVSGLELLAEDLASMGDASEIAIVLSSRLQACADDTPEHCRTLSMGLRVMRELLSDSKRSAPFAPSEVELSKLASVAGRCLESSDSGVRMDAVQLCVALHGRVGETSFWAAMDGVKDDPKSLITYYIVKRQRENSVSSSA